MKRLGLALLALCSMLALPSVQAKDMALPEDSIYHLNATLSDQSGKTFRLIDRRGTAQLVTMFYTSCKFVCPMIVDSAKGVEHALTPPERERLGILLISMDPARDDTAALKSVADKRKLDPTRWTLARTSEKEVRSLAALLGMRYRELADDEFNHTSALVLLDAEGRKIAQTSVLGSTPDAEFIKQLRKLVSKP